MPDRWRLRSAELTQLGRYTYLLHADRSEVPLRIVVSEGARADEVMRRSQKSAALRRVLPADQGLARLFGRLHHEGMCELDGVPVHCLISEFVPGHDLTALSRRNPPTGSLTGLRDVVRDLGVAFAELHALDPSEADLGYRGDPRLGWQRWNEHIVHWVWAMGKYLIDAPGSLVLGEVPIRQAQMALTRLESVVPELVRLAASEPQLSILHNDAHGGNFVAAPVPGVDRAPYRLTGILDERLRVGDPLFDLGALMDWALEVYDADDYLSFCDDLTVHYGLSDLDDSRLARLWIYHLERSLGRLAYYVPHLDGTQRPYTAVEVANMRRHLTVLELLAGSRHRCDPSACWLPLPSFLSLGQVRR